MFGGDTANPTFPKSGEMLAARHVCLECTRRKNWRNSYSFVVSLTIRAATWLKSSRLRPGDALGWDLAGFFFSGFDAFLFPMPSVYAGPATFNSGTVIFLLHTWDKMTTL